MDYRVHIAFGFHVNLYHSYRGDTPDRYGFGSDMQVIRKILDTLADANARGIPVRGTWNFDNAFSLERILPDYAPDLIDRIRLRVRTELDEVILMSYNNGLMSGMNAAEFQQAMAWSITNPHHSGIQDIFGRFAPIVRPQEMMFSPANIHQYRKIGIEALCLYYSSAPVDGFRTLIPLLPEGQAFNPINVCDQNESLSILPAISLADLIDYGGLGALARRLHGKQVSGEINSDVLILINTDADSPAWVGLNWPFPFSRLPLVNGLAGLIREISALSYVVFDTPGHYLITHPTQAEITFGQDIADGVFDGYASWAEKPVNHLLWSRIERIRKGEQLAAILARLPENQDLAGLAEHQLKRVNQAKIELLSTTCYGLAAPHLNRDRETLVLAQSAQALLELTNVHRQLAAAWWTCGVSPDVRKSGGPSGQEIQLILPDGFAGKPYFHSRFSLAPGFVQSLNALSIRDAQSHLASYALLPAGYHPDGSVAGVELYLFPESVACDRLEWILQSTSIVDDTLEAQKSALPPGSSLMIDETKLTCEDIVVICDEHKIAGLWIAGRKIGGRELFRSYVRYRQGMIGRDYDFVTTGKTLIRGAGSVASAGYRFDGLIQLSGTDSSGHFQFEIYLVERIKAVFVRMAIQYPQTAELDGVSDEISHLGRPYDSRWLEVAPLQITLNAPLTTKIVKYNDQGGLGQYTLAGFAQADPANQDLDAFNHQVTAGLVGFGLGEHGLLLATDRSRLSSLAFCPMRLKSRQQTLVLSANPFGTYAVRLPCHQTSTPRKGKSFKSLTRQVPLPMVYQILRKMMQAKIKP